jgi:endonuclease/exonuclease/phosphatase (EEP) superfamily protein YafD
LQQFSGMTTKRGLRFIRLSVAVIGCGALFACASQNISQPETNPARLRVAEIEACRASLDAAVSPAAGELDAGSIRLVSWNARKNKHGDWQRDLESLTRDMDLVLVQEASLRQDSVTVLDNSRYWSFAPGYRSRGAVSGVLTMSSSKPISQCNFVSVEPILRTPKATSITEYGLTSTDQTLVVVNIHAVNFSMGLGAFQEQFNLVRQVLATHDGPIILSGDFNTWRKKRAAVVDELAASLGLTALGFSQDERVKVFGNYLDHIYARGLLLNDSRTEVVNSSDHNALSVTLQM